MEVAEEDVRVRVARKRRERMHERLLSATWAAYLQAESGSLTAEDVMKAADVSRGTFYKYFGSIDEAVNVLGRRFADEAVAELRAILQASQWQPAARAALGAQMLMARGVMEAGWGKFVTSADHIYQDSAMHMAVRNTMIDGRRCGDFKFSSTATAVEFGLGVAMEGIRRLAAGHPHPIAYMCEVSAMMLKGLGAGHAAAELASTQTYRWLATVGPERLPWWKTLE